MGYLITVAVKVGHLWTLFVFVDRRICSEHAGRRQGVDFHRKESDVSVGGLGGVAEFRCLWCILILRADDVASDFTLRGMQVQSIHGDR